MSAGEPYAPPQMQCRGNDAMFQTLLDQFDCLYERVIELNMSDSSTVDDVQLALVVDMANDISAQVQQVIGMLRSNPSSIHTITMQARLNQISHAIKEWSNAPIMLPIDHTICQSASQPTIHQSINRPINQSSDMHEVASIHNDQADVPGSFDVKVTEFDKLVSDVVHDNASTEPVDEINEANDSHLVIDDQTVDIDTSGSSPVENTNSSNSTTCLEEANVNEGNAFKPKELVSTLIHDTVEETPHNESSHHLSNVDPPLGVSTVGRIPRITVPPFATSPDVINMSSPDIKSAYAAAAVNENCLDHVVTRRGHYKKSDPIVKSCVSESGALQANLAGSALVPTAACDHYTKDTVSRLSKVGGRTAAAATRFGPTESADQIAISPAQSSANALCLVGGLRPGSVSNSDANYAGQSLDCGDPPTSRDGLSVFIPLGRVPGALSSCQSVQRACQSVLVCLSGLGRSVAGTFSYYDNIVAVVSSQMKPVLAPDSVAAALSDMKPVHSPEVVAVASSNMGPIHAHDTVVAELFDLKPIHGTHFYGHILHLTKLCPVNILLGVGTNASCSSPINSISCTVSLVIAHVTSTDMRFAYAHVAADEADPISRAHALYSRVPTIEVEVESEAIPTPRVEGISTNSDVTPGTIDLSFRVAQTKKDHYPGAATCCDHNEVFDSVINFAATIPRARVFSGVKSTSVIIATDSSSCQLISTGVSMVRDAIRADGTRDGKLIDRSLLTDDLQRKLAGYFDHCGTQVIDSFTKSTMMFISLVFYQYYVLLTRLIVNSTAELYPGLNSGGEIVTAVPSLGHH
jgi:hypothetical protein